MLAGERVVLRPVAPHDEDELRALFAIPAIADAWPGDNDGPLEDVDVVGMAVVLDGRVIGFIRYYEEDDPNYRYAGIDVALHPDWCGQGLGTDAVRTLARHLFDDRGHHRIVIDPRTTNRRAIASYRKVGFKDVGVMRQYELANDGTWRDSLLMDLLADELT
jgi:aminoglycoside 6'-N-acetyltransferase